MKRSFSRPPLKVASPLTQNDIDNSPSVPQTFTWTESLHWLGFRRTASIIAWGICFAATAYLIYLAWHIPQMYRELSATIRG